jgi:AbrB family looped-hinge helix DNA binding protein
MPVGKMTSKGQVTVPKEVRERLGLRPGDLLEFAEVDGAFQIRKRLARDRLDKWIGYLKHLAGKYPDELVREMRDPW